MVIWHLHPLWNDHHSNSSNHLSSYEVIQILLTIFLMLYIPSWWLIHSLTENVCLLIPCICFALSPLHLPSGFFFLIYESVFILFWANPKGSLWWKDWLKRSAALERDGRAPVSHAQAVPGSRLGSWRYQSWRMSAHCIHLTGRFFATQMNGTSQLSLSNEKNLKFYV